MGFETKVLSDLPLTNGKIALGKILLSEKNETLDEIVVRGEVSKTVFKLDKRVFYVGKDIASTGASVLFIKTIAPTQNMINVVAPKWLNSLSNKTWCI